MGNFCCSAPRKENQIDRALIWMSGAYTEKFIEAVEKAEEQLKRPVTPAEMFVNLN